LPEAEAAHRKAIELEPDNARAYHNLGSYLGRQRKLAEAEAAFRKAIKLKRDYAMAYSRLGLALANQNKLFEAETAWRKAIELNPDDAEAYSNLGVSLRMQGKPAEAEAVHRKAIQINQDDAIAYRGLGAALSAQRKYLETVSAYRKAFELQPDRTDDRYNGACAAALAGCGQGDGATLAAKDRASLRGQALSWLRSLLTASQKTVEKQPGSAHPDLANNRNGGQRKWHTCNICNVCQRMLGSGDDFLFLGC
jgi:tetratricopeptide (TPR) repeat protein